MGKVQVPEDYGRGDLPPWTRDEWWCGDRAKDQGGSWAALDLALAYPSVRLCSLRSALWTMLGEAAERDDSKLLHGYPGPVLKRIEERGIRDQIAGSMMDALKRVEIGDGAIPRDAWHPPHALAKLPPCKDIGIPTGLAISGMLLNVALHSMDRKVEAYLQDQRGERRGAILRFADDMYLLSPSESGLFALIDAVWCALSNDSDAVLAESRTKTNLFLNLGKVRPDAIRDVVMKYVRSQGWEKCKECEDLAPATAMGPDERSTIGQWWIGRMTNGAEVDRLKAAVQRARLGRDDIGPFVTSLVERLSEIGRDTLTDRFGDGARTRLERLHELARFDIDDEQVRPDTRRTFASNRLVGAWLPPDEEEAALADIRQSVGHVLKKTPWKFSLWRSVVRAAARRTNSAAGDGDAEAGRWLSEQLRCVTHDEKERDGWRNCWPEEIGRGHERDDSWKVLYLSFHRAAFWQALRDVLRNLWQHQDRVESPDFWDAGPPPEWWTVRAVPEGRHGSVARFLGETDRWARVLYPKGCDAELRRWPWETDQFVGAVLAAHRRFDLARAWMRADPPGEKLTVPAGLSGFSRSETADLLRQAGRVGEYSGSERGLDSSSLAHVRFGVRDHRLANLLFPAAGEPWIVAGGDDAAHTVAAGVALGCAGNISDALLKSLVPAASERARRFRDDPASFWEYHRAHRILRSREAGAA